MCLVHRQQCDDVSYGVTMSPFLRQYTWHVSWLVFPDTVVAKLGYFPHPDGWVVAPEVSLVFLAFEPVLQQQVAEH